MREHAHPNLSGRVTEGALAPGRQILPGTGCLTLLEHP
jgi:hypothetical protein